MFLPAHIARPKSKSKEKISKKKKNGSKDASAEEVSAQPPSGQFLDTKSFFKLLDPATNLMKRGSKDKSKESKSNEGRSKEKSKESTPKSRSKEARSQEKSKSVEMYLPASKLKDRSRFPNKGYGYKRSSTSEDKPKSSLAFLDEELFLEDHTRNRRMKKKSLVSVLIRLGFTTLFLICAVILVNRDYPYDSFINEHTNFTATYPSITHYKMAILTEDNDAKFAIKNIIIDIGGTENYHREAAIVYTYYFDIFVRERTNISTTEFQTSLLAWGFNATSNNADPGRFSEFGLLSSIVLAIRFRSTVTDFNGGITLMLQYFGPVIIHNATLSLLIRKTEFNFGQLLQFSKLENSSSIFAANFSENALITLPLEYVKEVENADRSRDLGTKRQGIFANICGVLPDVRIVDDSRPSSVEPQVNRIESLPFHVSEKFGFLQFASSGPKTLGTIAEIAIQVALESILKFPADKKDFGKVDVMIAKAIMNTVHEVARHPGYFKNLTLNYQEVMGNVSLKFATNRPNTVKMHTNGALTSNLLILDNRDGWPSMMHFGISAPGPLYLQYNNRNSSEMLNVCQVIVMKDGYLWLTAAASGEFYLLEKVVASIVYKIVYKTDPLETLDRENRLHYDTRNRKLSQKKYPPKPKESLLFSEYQVGKNRFRSWSEPLREIKNGTEIRTENYPTGF